ncbi:F-box protein CPR1-like [Silene latifolia]|uniref:F-box protein CPR1-like n=1 Tax=Silene latifolia TaxID=37657 RepID=UPI003D770ED6
MAVLPMVLITEILSRLPVKSLVRFGCVSKPWDSLIKDPIFIKLHLKHSLETDTNQTLIIRDGCLYSLDFPVLNSLTLIDHPLKTDRFETELQGSCNGPLCLYNDDEEGMNGTIFYNPATRKHIDVPVSEIELPGDQNYALARDSSDRTVYGFGYDHVTDDYKLVRVIQFMGGDEFDSEVKVYSLNSGSWGGICYFLREYYLTYKRLWGYYPEYSDTEFHIDVGVLKGCLCVLCNYVDVKSEFWVMEEYDAQNSWTKMFSIAQRDIIGVYEYVRPLARSKEGSRVLVEQDGKSLFWFDLEIQTIDNVEVAGLRRMLDAEMMVESLVPLECSQRKVKPKVKKVHPKLKEKKSKQKSYSIENLYLGFSYLKFAFNFR